MSTLIVTVDLDWASESAIEETLDFLQEHNISPTIFTTHRSRIVEESLNNLEVGLHPYFGLDSSHGSTIADVVSYVMDLPHNLPAFRCHRFAVCNSSKQAMAEAGMLISSNVCTDLEVVPPFRDRCGFLEVPIFLEDGGYLWRQHSLSLDQRLQSLVLGQGVKVITIHPMHFTLNTPHFTYMYNIKQSTGRDEWKNMTQHTLNRLRWSGRGIRNLIVELLQIAPKTSSLRSLLTTC